MIYKVIIENFFSIADPQEIIFDVSANAPDLPCFKLSRSNQKMRLPVVIGFFGPNASGKSTVLRAIVNAAVFATRSFGWVDEMNNLFQPYRQKEWWGKPTKITIEFDGQLSENAPSVIFRYELHVAHQANNLGSKEILYEALSCAPQNKFRRLFKREGQNFYFGHEFNISNSKDPRTQSIRTNASVMSTLAKFNHSFSMYLCNLIISGLQTNIIGFYKIQQNLDQLFSIYIKDKNCLENLNKELRRLDIGLEFMCIKESPQGLFAEFKHAGLDESIFFAEESAGTKRFIEIFPRIYYALMTGGVVLIDEMDTDLHPLLLPELFRWFGDLKRNSKGAQLLFTAHNPALLDELEKEQVFLTEKSSGQSTHVYGVRDIKGLRREPSLMKKYLAGVLGAVPYVG